MKPETRGITISRNGEPILTIETNHLSGKDLDHEDEKVVMACINDVLSFLGKKGIWE